MGRGNPVNKRLVCGIAVLVLCPELALGATLTVDPTGAGDAQTIGGAVALAGPGDVIDVLPGTYPEVVDPGGLAITIRSTGGASATTIAPPASTCVRFVSGETSDTVLSGFTVSGCATRGVWIEASGPTLRDLVITGNGATGIGGGMLVDDGSPSLERIVFAQNSGSFGGGLAITGSSDVNAVRTSFSGNTASGDGGGVWLQQETPPLGLVSTWTFEEPQLTWLGGLVVGNTAGGDGGGIYAEIATLTISGLQLSANSAGASGGAIATYGGTLSADASSVEANTAPVAGGVRTRQVCAVIAGGVCPFLTTPVDPIATLVGVRFEANTGTPATELWGDATITDCEFIDHLSSSGFGDAALDFTSQTRFGGAGTSSDTMGTLAVSRSRFVGNEIALAGRWGFEADDLVSDSWFSSNEQAVEDPVGALLMEGGLVAANGPPTFGTADLAAVSAPDNAEASLVHDVVFVDNASRALEIGGQVEGVVSGSLFLGNVGGLAFLSAQADEVVGSTFVGNDPALTGIGAQGVVSGNIFTYNIAPWAVTAGSYVGFVENVDYANGGATYTGAGPATASGNQTTFPGFVLYSANGDWTDDDFQLASTSPVLDSWPAGGVDADGTVADPGAFGGPAPMSFDADGDGFTRVEGDCIDVDPEIHPGAPERANWLDDDCDGLADEGVVDLDGDGFVSSPVLPWYASDCDDGDAARHPDAPDACDGVDNDCDGLVDEDFDLDGDGVSPCDGDCDDSDPLIGPGQLEPVDGVDNDCDGSIDEPEDLDGDGVTVAGGDCDDLSPAVWPGAVEWPDGVDNDCDGLVDEGLDVDGDGYATDDGDCDDSDPAVSPGLVEACDGLDTDCDGALSVDELDGDGDGATACDGDCGPSDPAIGPAQVETCDGVDEDCDGQVDNGFDADGDGWTTCAGDCDDAAPTVNPGWAELCNGTDDDCDGAADEDFDLDGDGLTTCAGDCDDLEPFVGGAAELCDGLDNDCDGGVDEDFDRDGDGWIACTLGSGPDCDDLQPTVFPGAPESCDLLDNDCNGAVDDVLDWDGDGATECTGDCDDQDPTVLPGGPEVTCDGVDENCDGAVDEAFDGDGDGWTSCGGDCDDSRADASPDAAEVCNELDDDCDFDIDEGLDMDGDGETPCGGDCDDADPLIGPSAPESCDGIDQDCDGTVDEGFDLDADGVSSCAGDCDDSDPAVAPGIPEVCDGVDQDCDGAIDDGLDQDGDGFTPCAGDPDDGDASVFPGALQPFQPTPSDPVGCSASGSGPASGWWLLLVPVVFARRRRLSVAAAGLLCLAPAASLGASWSVTPAPMNNCCQGSLGPQGGDFSTLPAAIAAVPSGDTIEVSWCYCSTEVLNPGSKTLAITSMGVSPFEIGGCTIDGGGALEVENVSIDGDILVSDGTLTLIDATQSSSYEETTVSGGQLQATVSRLHNVEVTSGALNVSGGQIRAFPGWPPLEVTGGVVTIDGVDEIAQWTSGAAQAPERTAMGPVVIGGGQVTVVNLVWGVQILGTTLWTIPGPSASSAFFEVSGGTLVLDGPQIEADAGPILLATGGSVNWDGGAVVGISTPSGPGVIEVPAGSTATVDLSGVAFDGVGSLTDGGIARVADGALTLTDPVVNGSFATQGGVLAVEGGTVDWVGGLVAGPTASRGGAVWVAGGAVDLLNVGITDATATEGGAFLVDGGVLSLGFCTVLGSQAGGGTGHHVDANGGAWSASHTAFAFSPFAGQFSGVPASTYAFNHDFGDPFVASWISDAQTANDDLWPSSISPLIDGGDPALLDVDGSTADIGISGGAWGVPGDFDGDGYPQGVDCDDLDPAVNSGAIEVCDGADNDCDGSIDEGLDLDGDGITPCAGDCNDGDASILPGSTELCDGLDQDCDGAVDEGWDLDGDGVTSCAGDCADLDPATSPLTPEVCDGFDNDCDGAADEDFDADADGFGACFDCDDTNAAVSPSTTELCDGVDQDCDGLIDDGFDLDLDGATVCAGDCDDGSALIGPAVPETCDGLDNDCDGLVDTGCPEPVGDDNDLGDDDDSSGDDDDSSVGDDDDSVGDDDDATGDDDDATGDDDDSGVSLDCSSELCDGLDNDCDGFVDEDWDQDSDGFADCGVGPTNPGGGARDCRDGDPLVFPGAPEACNLLDDDCDGTVDEGFDADGDGWTRCGGDCDDGRAAVYPQAPEDAGTGSETGVDNDCDGRVDEGVGCAHAGEGAPAVLLIALLLPLLRRRSTAALLLLLVPGVAVGATWTVDASGGGNFLDIPSAVAAASTGDTIVVAPGAYVGPVDFAGKDVVIESSGGAAVTSLSGAGRVVLAVSGESTAAILDGFSLSGGGGCVLVLNSGLTLLDNTLSSCGGGALEGSAILAASSASVVSSGNTIQGNASLRGAVSIQSAASWTSTADTISSNTATDRGGGLYIDQASATLDAVTLSSNTATNTGGGGYIEGGQLTLLGGLVQSNTSNNAEGGGLYIDASTLWSSGTTFNANQIGTNNGMRVGGAVFAAPFSDVQIGQAQFTNNEATYGGAVAIHEDVTLGVYGSTFDGNTALMHADLSIGTYGSTSTVAILPTSQVVLADSVFQNFDPTPLGLGAGTVGPGSGDADSVVIDNCTFGDAPTTSTWTEMNFRAATVTILNSEFGAGLLLTGEHRQIQPNFIEGTLGVYGSTFLGSAGIQHSGTATVQRTTLVDTTSFWAAINGDGAYADLTVQNVDIFGANNRAIRVGATSLVENTLVVDTGAGLYWFGSGGGFPTVRYSNFWNVQWISSQSTFSTQPGILQVDPQVTAWSNDGDPTNDDLTRLTGSPMIDAGNPALFDEDGSPSDIGALGGLNLAGDEDGDGYSTLSNDCDDGDSTVYPFAPELCDGVDNDCDGLADQGFDADSDGVTVCDGDCDDSDPLVMPGAVEICDGDDENCDGNIDEGFDADADGVSSCTGDCDDTDATVAPGMPELCGGGDEDCDGQVDEGFDADLDGVSSCAGDCDDAEPASAPGLPEVCDVLDNDCDGLVDEGLDADGDSVTPCGGDCDDQDATVSPAAVEICDGLDNDCDGVLDDGLDGDLDGYTPCEGDCDDSSELVSPEGVELCDGLDNDCDGDVDLGIDADGDGAEACPPSGVADCDDADPARAPGLEELCDGLDNDCDGAIDPGFDQDGDGLTSCAGDCDDADAGVGAGLPELCDGLDNDCDGVVDEGCGGDDDDDDDDSAVDECPAWSPEVCNDLDDDCDGLVDEGFDGDRDGVTTCAGDCDDSDAATSPLMAERRDGMDNDCDGVVDNGVLPAEGCSCGVSSSPRAGPVLVLLLALVTRRRGRR